MKKIQSSLKQDDEYSELFRVAFDEAQGHLNRVTGRRYYPIQGRELAVTPINKSSVHIAFHAIVAEKGQHFSPGGELPKKKKAILSGENAIVFGFLILLENNPLFRIHHSMAELNKIADNDFPYADLIYETRTGDRLLASLQSDIDPKRVWIYPYLTPPSYDPPAAYLKNMPEQLKDVRSHYVKEESQAVGVDVKDLAERQRIINALLRASDRQTWAINGILDLLHAMDKYAKDDDEMELSSLH